ncbi:MAG: peptide ABC transporter substrate-binding protein [Gemmatimonadales bacterium]|nr:peptide ABC transporter substrate-binding protein [Gemmatimonadales bacterium]
MTSWLGLAPTGARRLLLAALLTGVGAPAQAQAPREATAVSIVLGAEPTIPVPAFSSSKQNVDAASLIFLPLARLNRKLETTAERSFEPLLARSWSRRDSLTLVFELDPRARWHDGVPVTSRDVVFSLTRFRDTTVSRTYALLLRDLAAVTADGLHRVVVSFRRPYPEQLFDAVHHVWPLPAHLLDSVPPARLTTAAFVSRPIGSGPFRWGRLEPGRLVELVANPEFFLGKPGVDRVLLLVVRAAEAQLNLMLDGTADAFEAFLVPNQITPLVQDPSLRLVTQPSLGVGYLLFNQKALGDRSKPHPILSDPAVRRALALGIDRPSLIRSVFGPYATVVDGPMGQASWIRRIAPKQPGANPAAARRLLAERGWRDTDGDGIVDKGGVPLSLRLAYPGSSLPRVSTAEPIQEMLRRIGVRIELVRLDGPVWFERRNRGEFDIDYSQAVLDPTPSGLVQSWSCAGIGGSNVAHVCDPAFDAALTRAIGATDDPARHWREAIGVLQSTQPAVFLYSPVQSIVLRTRLRRVTTRPDLPWADLWRWTVDPAPRAAR